MERRFGRRNESRGDMGPAFEHRSGLPEGGVLPNGSEPLPISSETPASNAAPYVPRETGYVRNMMTGAAQDVSVPIASQPYGAIGGGAAGPDGAVRKVTEEDIAKANGILMKYRSGKANLDARIRSSEKWWRMRHWSEMEAEGNPWDIRPRSGWLFNVIISKHADGIQSVPEANVLPREKNDRETARMLSSVIPCVLEQNHFSTVYSEVLWQKLKQGTGVYGVYWDGGKLGGLGDVEIECTDVLNLYWEPGITDIQDSRNVFYVQLIDNEVIEEKYPQLKGKLGDRSVAAIPQNTEDNIDVTEKSAVVDWYYKRSADGQERLHYCKYCGNEILYSSENEGMESWYDHGLYPFVFDPLYPMEKSPCGFGLIDVAKSDQEYIDLLRQAMLKNALWNATPRFMVRQDGVVNEEEASDWRRTFVHVDAQLGTDAIREMPGRDVTGGSVNLLNSTIEELKQTTGNTDASTGVNQSSTQAASAIAALQEASGKTSRASTLSAYRAFEKLVKMVIELIRQFYDVTRTFRITGEQGDEAFVQFDNSGLQPQPQGTAFGVDLGYRLPEFDLKINAQTATQYTKNMANEWATQLWALGIFEPANADKALMMLTMMDFEGKDDVMQMISRNAQMQEQLLQYQQLALSLAAKYEPQMAEGLSQQIMGQAGMQTAPAGGPGQAGDMETPGDVQAQEIAQVRNARAGAAQASQPDQ